ncbi:MAG: ATP-binding protein [Rhodobacter sp.]|nr:ATP-binding protein [Rhodobacter sp.]
MTAFQRDALQDFVDDGAKDHPPVFVGREDLLGEILTKARRSLERVRSGQPPPPGNAIIIQGAPGAGKSSVLRELATQNVQPHVPKTLEISSVELCDQFGDVLRAIGALGTTPKSQLKKLAQTATRTLGNLALLDVLGGADLSRNLAALFQSHNIETIGSLHQAFPASHWDSPVIVAVDEAQNLAPRRDSTAARFLQAIHEARTKLPLTLVCAGLGDTQSRLRDLGLTHGIRAHALGCLTRTESTTLLERFCAHFGMTMERCRGRALAVVHTTDGWPRHVHWAQQALAEAALEPDVNGDLDRITDWDRVQARSDELRHGYYATQFSQDMAVSRKLVGRVMFELGKARMAGQHKTIGQVIDLVDAYADSGASREWRLPKGLDSESYVTHLIHCGALQDNPDTDSLTCPIPSFQRYIITRGGLDPDQLPAHPAA